jgi:hypothetical protein
MIFLPSWEDVDGVVEVKGYVVWSMKTFVLCVWFLILLLEYY